VYVTCVGSICMTEYILSRNVQGMSPFFGGH
jgi:hypothetical protein